MKPTKPITDPSFVWWNSAQTDVRATWNRLVPGWRERKPKAQANTTVVALKLKERK